MHWAETPYAMPALFLIAVAESSFFPIPPDVLLIALAVSLPTNSFRYALVCSIGSVLGGVIGYWIGFSFMDLLGFPILNFYGAMNHYDRLSQLYNTYNAWAVGIAGFTPIPYKVFTIAAGACKIDFGVFLLASLVSRSARFFLVAGLFYWKGATIKAWIDRYFNLAVTLFTILLIGGFILIKWVLHA